MIVCTLPTLQAVLVKRKLRRAIQHAQLLCPNFEDTVECRLAWEEVDDYEKALRKQAPAKKTCLTERAERDYDS